MGYGSGVAMSCGIGRRCGLDLVLLWLWSRLAATAPIPPLAWELPNGAPSTLKKKKKKKGQRETDHSELGTAVDEGGLG